jgi:hypothetical protein
VVHIQILALRKWNGFVLIDQRVVLPRHAVLFYCFLDRWLKYSVR